jgi:hypothetical protein
MRTQKGTLLLVWNICQRTWNISQRNDMPLDYNLQIDLCDIWGIGFMGPFTNSNEYEHILFMVDYASKWVEAIS